MADGPFSEAELRELRDLWAQGISTAEIGRRMNRSKNSIVGKAHRLNLPARASPIIRDSPNRGHRRYVQRAVGATLPPLASERPVPTPSRPIFVAPAPTPSGVQFHAPRSAPCVWPIGTPGAKGFKYCDAPNVPGRPYCQEHHAIAYVKRRPRLDDEAAPAFPHPSVQFR